MIPQDLPVRHRTGSYRERRSLSLLGMPPVRGRPAQPSHFLRSLLGAPLTGAIRDATGDYTVPLICLAVAAFLGSLCASLIRHEEGQL